MPSGGKEAIWRAEMAAAQRAYKQQAAAEERAKRRLAARDIAMDASMRGLLEAKRYITSMPPLDKEDGHMDPQSATVSLVNRAIREIKKARDS